MKKIYRKTVWLLLAALMIAAGSGFSAPKTAALPAVGGALSGFTLEKTERLPVPGAASYFTHEETGAQAVYIARDGLPLRVSLAFRLPEEAEPGLAEALAAALAAGTNGAETEIAGGVLRLTVTAETEDALRRAAGECVSACFGRPAETAAESTPAAEAAETLQTAARRNFLAALLPGSAAAALPESVPSIGEAALTGYAGACLAPANALAVVCGSAESCAGMLALLDETFALCEPGEAVRRDAAYRRLEAPVERECVYELAADAAEEDGTAYFGIVCPRAGTWERQRLEALAAAFGRSGSVLEKRVSEALGCTSVRCGTETAGADAAFWVCASPVAAEDAPLLRDTVLAVLRDTAENGFSAAAVETLDAAQRLEELTFPDAPELGDELCAGFARAWAAGDAAGYPAALADTWNAAAYLADGSCAELLREELLAGERYALVTTTPKKAEAAEKAEEEG